MLMELTNSLHTMLQECIKYRTLIKNLVLKDLKLKYRGSVLGVVWSLLRPLMLIGVYTLAFKFVVRIKMENYTFFLLIGLLPWNFFSGAAMASTNSLIDNANLIKKVYFPRETLPIATVLFNFAQFLLALAVFIPLFFFMGAFSFQWVTFLFLPLLAFHLLFTIGISLGLSSLTSSFRDVAHLTEVGVVLLFWVTPVIYPLTMVPVDFQWIMKISPLASFTMAYQDILFWGRVPDPWAIASLVCWSAVLFWVGSLTFKWYDPALAELV
ncbi:MAG: ABC transporter permease [Pseudomonadota bacterium]